ncbi:hypothetical protein [Burkholderia lata]|uniref:hypothetical protein n=1 Tax=Burkholderia lata (strain ATCC 17760 / DSM 23089 / LMG 22485 / NCIMB 9086 / R18194 / 383) TaxID=482957 RepID=UPI0012E9F51C|nr:hypothetical protein [Burkholderia lata]
MGAFHTVPYGVQNAGATACPLIDLPSLASASATLFALQRRRTWGCFDGRPAKPGAA